MGSSSFFDSQLFKLHLGFMHSAAALCYGQADRIHKMGQGLDKSNPVIERSKIATLMFYSRSLKVYADTLRYLSEQVETRTDQGIFLLPNLRGLIDIYARCLQVVILSEKHDCTDAITCVGYQLISYKFLKDYSSYQETLNFYRPLLQNVSFEFPHQADLNYRWLKAKKVNFWSNDTILTVNNIKDHSVYTDEVFGADKYYEIYSYLSGISHGNPYTYYNSSRSEIFWIISMGVYNSAFLIELINKYVIGAELPKDFRVWLRDAKKNRLDFARAWKDHSKKIKQQDKQKRN